MSLIQKLILATGITFIALACISAFAMNDFKLATVLAAVGSAIGFGCSIYGQLKVRESDKRLNEALDAIGKIEER